MAPTVIVVVRTLKNTVAVETHQQATASMTRAVHAVPIQIAPVTADYKGDEIMLNPNDFNTELHLTLVLLSAAATLFVLHTVRFIFSNRNRANDLQGALNQIRRQEKSNEVQFKGEIGKMNTLVNEIQEASIRNYDQVVLSDLTDHETRIIEEAQHTQTRSERMKQSVTLSKEVDQQIDQALPGNTTALANVENAITNLAPLLQDFSKLLESIDENSPFEGSYQYLNRSTRTHAELIQAVKALRRTHLGHE